jgi:hypothetical protein
VDPADDARPPAAGTGGPVGVLVLCTANICRSPMGEALLADRLAAVRVPPPGPQADFNIIPGPRRRTW